MISVTQQPFNRTINHSLEERENDLKQSFPCDRLLFNKLLQLPGQTCVCERSFMFWLHSCQWFGYNVPLKYHLTAQVGGWSPGGGGLGQWMWRGEEAADAGLWGGWKAPLSTSNTELYLWFCGCRLMSWLVLCRLSLLHRPNGASPRLKGPQSLALSPLSPRRRLPTLPNCSFESRAETAIKWIPLWMNRENREKLCSGRQ